MNTKQSNHKRVTLKQAMAAILMTGTLLSAQGAQNISAAEAEQINAELAPVANPEANAEKVGSVPEDPAAVVGSRFSYQGTLRLGNDRANGPYDFRFRLYNQAAGGTQLGSTSIRNDLPVSDGLFSTELDFGQANIAGDDIFLQIEVRDGASGGVYTILSPRQRINATPYAVRALLGGDGGGGSSPWTVSGSTVFYNGGHVGIGVGGVNGQLTINSPAGNTFPLILRVDGSSRLVMRENGGLAIGNLASGTPAPNSGLLVSGRTEMRASNDASLVDGSGVLVIGPESGENVVLDGNEILARDNGVASTFYVGAEGGSIITSTNGHGLLAVGSKSTGSHISIDGDDIQKKTGNGVGTLFLNYYGGPVAIASANAATTIRGELKQSASKGGALKAAVYIENCGGTSGTNVPVTRQYNGVNGTTITAKANAGGKCTIDFPFNVNGRFWSVSAANGPGTSSRGAMCDVSSGINDKLVCARWNTSTDSLITGQIMVLVY